MSEYDKIISQLANIEASLLRISSPWMNISEASHYSRLSDTTLRRLVKAGKLPDHRANPDGNLLFCKREIDAFLHFGKTKLTRPQKEAIKDLM